jgi:hypothetical protein
LDTLQNTKGFPFHKPPLDLSCRGGSHTSALSLGKGTRGHEPEGVPKSQENAQIQEPPLTGTCPYVINSHLLFPPFSFCRKETFPWEHENI